MTMGIPEPLAWFFVWLGRTSLQASVLVVLIMAVLALTRDRLAPRWRHGLWMLLVIRLLLPWAPPSRMSVFNYFDPLKRIEINKYEATAPPPPAPAEPALSMAPSVQYLMEKRDGEAIEAPAASMPSSRSAESDPPAATQAQAPVATDRSPRLPAWLGASWLAALWLGGFLALMSMAISQSLALGAALRKQRPVTDQQTLDLLEACKDTLGVRAWLAVVEAPGIASPALLGFVRPRLLLPAGAIREMGPDRLRHIFLHELAHLKRRDILVNWLLTALQAVHWFNPLVWLAFRRMREDRELACDALVLASLGPEESSEYGRTIIHLLERFARPRLLAGLAGILEDKQQIKRRLTMIARFKRPSMIGSLVAASLMLLLGSAALTSARPERVEVKREARDENAKETRNVEYNIVETRTDEKGTREQKDGKPAVQVRIADFNLQPGEKDGQYLPVVTIKNNGSAPTPSIDVKFFRNDEERKNQDMNGAGPIKPGETWNETPGPVTLNEGENRFTVVLDPNGKLQEGVKAPVQAELQVRVKDGKIVGKGLSIKGTGKQGRSTGSSYSISHTADDKAARAKLESAKAEYEVAKKRVEAGVSTTDELIKAEMVYKTAQAMVDGNKLAASQAHVDGTKQLLEITRKKIQIGLATQTDLAKAEADLAAAEAELERAKAAGTLKLDPVTGLWVTKEKLEHDMASGVGAIDPVTGQPIGSGESQVETITKDGKTITIIRKSTDPTKMERKIAPEHGGMIERSIIMGPNGEPIVMQFDTKKSPAEAAADQKARAELERALAMQKALVAQAQALADMARKQAEQAPADGQKELLEQAQKMQATAQKQMAELQARMEELRAKQQQEAQARGEKVQEEMRQRMEKMQEEMKRSKTAMKAPIFWQKAVPAPGGARLQVKEIRVEPADGGKYRVVVSIANDGKETAPQFKVYMIRNAEEWKKAGGKIDKNMGSHGVGPIKSGETWNEGSLPFELSEGENQIAIVIDPEGGAHEAVPTERSADLVVTVKDGKVAGQRVSIKESSKGGKSGAGYGFSTIGHSSGPMHWEGGQGGFGGGMMGGGTSSGGFGGGASYHMMPPIPQSPAHVIPAPPAPKHESGGGSSGNVSFDGVRPAKVAPIPVLPAIPAKTEKSDTDSGPIALAR